MLTESQVIDAVCRYLDQNGWRIIGRCSESERGDDIVAEDQTGTICVIEAKGETSSKTYTARHGNSFSSGQVTSHVSRAFFRAVQKLDEGKLSGMAFPRNALHWERIASIQKSLRHLKVEVFWVSADGTVTVEGFWPVRH